MSTGKKAENNGYVFAVDDWLMDKVIEYNDLRFSGQLRKFMEFIGPFIKQWPFEGSPSDVASFGKLKPKEWEEVRDSFQAAVEKLFQ